jgi:hypothetical protein
MGLTISNKDNGLNLISNILRLTPITFCWTFYHNRKIRKNQTGQRVHKMLRDPSLDQAIPKVQ